MSLLNLAWWIPLFPFLAFIVIFALMRRKHTPSGWLATGGVALSFVLSQIVFWAAVMESVKGESPTFESPAIPWFTTGLEEFTLGVYIDPVTTLMLFTTSVICLMISVYSLGYLRNCPRRNRCFAYISLGTASALGMAIFDNLLTFFIFWEIMDACSYLLVSLGHERSSAVQGSLKLFLMTKTSDLFFLSALTLIYAEIGSLAYRDVFNPNTLALLADAPFPGTSISLATAISLLLFGAAVGKSAQFPLHVWLPDAADTPTPGLALIHCATTVPAGAYLILRAFPVFAAAHPVIMGGSVAAHTIITGGSAAAHTIITEGSAAAHPGFQMTLIVAVGTLTAALSAILAVAQHDIRRGLAFSTVSQLGSVIAALGFGAYEAGAFHLMTHAFVKTLLILSSGSIRRGVELGRHHANTPRPTEEQAPTHPYDERFNPNDMMYMGGLARRMPRTFWSFLIGGLALSGFPVVTTSFWSRDRILAQAYGWNRALFWTLAVTAGLTALYSMRQICLVFFGQPRTKTAQHAEESGGTMTWPLLLLIIFAVALGWIGIPQSFPIIGGSIPDFFHRFIWPMLEPEHLAGTSAGFGQRPTTIGLAFTLGGLAAGWLIYGWKPMRAGERDRLETGMQKVWLGWLYVALREGLYLDQLYYATIAQGTVLIASILDILDHGGIDGLVRLAGNVARILSQVGDWFDTHVIDAAVNLVRRATKKAAELGNSFDLHIIDRLVDLTGMSARRLAHLSATVDTKGVDGAVEGIGATVQAGIPFIRPTQTGSIQDDLLQAALMVLTLIVVFFIIMFLRI